MKLQITTPARLHFGLIDLNGELGRINGGFGVAIDHPNWIITLKKHEINSYQLKFEKNIKKQYIKLNTQVPSIYPEVIKWAEKFGFEKYGVDKESYLKNNNTAFGRMPTI